jgi:hypothetical protein
MLEEPLIFEIGSADTTGVDFGEAPAGKSRLGGLERRQGDRPARPVRARDGAALHPPQPPELRDRPRPVPARQLHDEA